MIRASTRITFSLTGISLALVAQVWSQYSHKLTLRTVPTPAHELRVRVPPRVLDELGRLADSSSFETVRCLMGTVRGDTAQIYSVMTPRIYRRTETTVVYQACPPPTVAVWHNHPWTHEPTPEDACYLSRTDIQDALRPKSPVLQMVQVTDQVSCWWLRQQIESYRDRNIMWPMRDQYTRRPSERQAGSR